MRYILPIIFLFSNLIFAEIASNSVKNIFSLNDTLITFHNNGITIFSDSSNYQKSINFNYPIGITYDNMVEHSLNNSFLITYNNKQEIKLTFYNFNGTIIQTLTQPAIYSEADDIYSIAEKNDTLFMSHKIKSGFRFYLKQNWYYIQIDTIPNSNILLNNNPNFFYTYDFDSNYSRELQNASLSCNIIDNEYFALTLKGIYTSKELEIWHRKVPKNLNAQFVFSINTTNTKNGKFYFLKATNKVTDSSLIDKTFPNPNSQEGYFYSFNTLDSVNITYKIPYYKDVSITDSFLYYFNNDTLFYWNLNRYNTPNFSTKIIETNSDNINAILLKNNKIFIATDDHGLAIGNLYSSDYQYISVNKEIKNDLTEFYAYPTIINSNNGKTTFAYALTNDDYITIEIFDFNGDLVKTVVKNSLRLSSSKTGTKKSTNFKEDTWDGRDRFGKIAEPGTYFYKISAKNINKSVIGKVILLKGN